MTACFAFVLALLSSARPLLVRLIVKLQADHHTSSRRASVLSLIVLLALFGASFTQWVGIHAVFGGFVVGVVVGDAPQLKERTRVIVHEFVTNIFAPVFFASLGLRADFVRSFDLRLWPSWSSSWRAARRSSGVHGRRARGRPAVAPGRGRGVRAQRPRRDGGSNILALLAVEAGLLREQVFVALVVMALATSLVSGPTMKWMLRGVDEE